VKCEIIRIQFTCINWGRLPFRVVRKNDRYSYDENN